MPMSSKHPLDIQSQSLCKRPRHLNANLSPPAHNQAAPLKVLEIISVNSDGPEETKDAQVKALDVISIHSDGYVDMKATKVGVLDAISIHSDGCTELQLTNTEPSVGLKDDSDDDDERSFEDFRLVFMRSTYAVERWRESTQDALSPNENAPDPNEKIVPDVVQTDADTRAADLTLARYHASNLSLIDVQELCHNLQGRCYDLHQRLASVQGHSDAGWSLFWASDVQCQHTALELNQAHLELDKAREEKDQAQEEVDRAREELDRARKELHEANDAQERTRKESDFWHAMFNATKETSDISGVKGAAWSKGC
ncbi:hypothetical protein K435DRAFT_797319 [Dendrothele bispora CBS 962.96]|uniref:Uncharacterized protein n=1 Tax=Dendrothele bispora (strain CBS 962.96) TaxID=1314807 RepID=A0A4S8M3Y4_DENBC|nr:hypothetical protein K435DRAFT_797319 [Dendrothele bispora CBS 962.96]